MKLGALTLGCLFAMTAPVAASECEQESRWVTPQVHFQGIRCTVRYGARVEYRFAGTYHRLDGDQWVPLSHEPASVAERDTQMAAVVDR